PVSDQDQLLTLQLLEGERRRFAKILVGIHVGQPRPVIAAIQALEETQPQGRDGALEQEETVADMLDLVASWVILSVE
ncbi:MAG: hypothetical protein ACKO8X_07310, partial [Verrucomicrobiota bacterium]